MISTYPAYTLTSPAGSVVLNDSADNRTLHTVDIDDGTDSEAAVYAAGIGDGSVLGPTRNRGLRRVVQVLVRGDSWATREASEAGMRAVLDGMRSADGNVSWVQTLNNDPRSMKYLRCTQKPRKVESINRFRIIEFELTSALPHYVGTGQEAEGSLLTDTGGGWSFPFTFPIEFTASGGGTVTIENDGNTAAYPVLTIQGPITSPRIIEVGGTRRLSLPGLVIAAGQSVVVDVRTMRITLGETRVREYLDPSEQSRLTVPAAGTTFQLLGSSYTSATRLDVASYDAWEA